jgi:hypothetical protein
MDHLKPAQIERKIYEIRGHRVMLDVDLAHLYATETKFINRAVKRNSDRFPPHFSFQLTEIEWESLRFHIGTFEKDYGRRKYLPSVFTKHGVVMLANVLRSQTAVKVSIEIVNAFIALRKMALDYGDLETRISKLEQKYDQQFKDVFASIRQLLRQSPILDPKRRRIGLRSDSD